MPLVHVEDGYRLGQWVNDQRTAYAQGPARRRPGCASRSSHRLELGPATPTNGRKDFAACAASSTERVTPVCHRITWRTATGSAGGWASSEAAYAKGQLAADRVARLEAVPGWTWDLLADQWEEGFRYLCRFVDREGHARCRWSCRGRLPARPVGEQSANRSR